MHACSLVLAMDSIQRKTPLKQKKKNNQQRLARQYGITMTKTLITTLIKRLPGTSCCNYMHTTNLSQPARPQAEHAGSVVHVHHQTATNQMKSPSKRNHARAASNPTEYREEERGVCMRHYRAALLVEVALEADPVLLRGYLLELVEVVLGDLQERRLLPDRLLVALLPRLRCQQLHGEGRRRGQAGWRRFLRRRRRHRHLLHAAVLHHCDPNTSQDTDRKPQEEEMEIGERLLVHGGTEPTRLEAFAGLGNGTVASAFISRGLGPFPWKGR